MKINKVIFLDIDGVLCIKGKLLKELIINLKTIVEKTGARLVLSSNWRLYEHHRNRISETLSKYGMEIVSYTDSLADIRPYEIFSWIKKNKPDMCIILDDRPLDKELYGEMIKSIFIKTNQSIGLKGLCVEKAIFFLNTKQILYDDYALRISLKNIKKTYTSIYNQKKEYYNKKSIQNTIL